MHEEEARNQKTGTGRLAALCLKNSELLVGVDFSADARVNALLADPAYAPFVLYPGPKAANFGTLGRDALPEGKVPLVFVIDGTWRTARTLLNRSRNVGALPRLSFAGAYRSRFSIKKQPMEHCVSTIEAIYHLCREAEAAGHEKLGDKCEVLLDVLQKIVDTQVHYQRTVGHRREDNARGRR
jgi:DTW domain-containing protein YfiP